MTQPTAEPPFKVAIIPVTPLQQNCTLVWCTKTMRGAFIDAGGDLEKLRKAIEMTGVTIEKLLVTHGADRGPSGGRSVLDRATG